MMWAGHWVLNPAVVVLLLSGLGLGAPLLGQEPTSWQVLTPRPYQVVQRIGFVPQRAAVHEPGGAIRGFADVLVELQAPQADSGVSSGLTVEGRAVAMRDEFEVVPWGELLDLESGDDGRVQGNLRLPAGGWYRLQLRAKREEVLVAEAEVQHIGVGEVFLVAGQSYATNCNDAVMKVTDAEQRVAAYDSREQAWRVAHDPQPVIDGSDGGSIWPLVGDSLAAIYDVPIGFANVAYGGTSSTQWRPGESLHQRLVEVGTGVGQFRAVLWQQGESDVIDGRSTDEYVAAISAIREQAVQAWDVAPRWYLAKSTLHPTVYNDPAGESRIRRAIDRLWEMPGFGRGPDTDLLDGIHRGGPESRRHFSEIGQRRAAEMWFAVLHEALSAPRPEHEAWLGEVQTLRLFEPAWRSQVVHRESSVLLAKEAGAAIEARLAFPAAELLEVRSADGRLRFEIGTDVTLSDDGCRVIFQDPKSIPVLTEAELYPPQDAPNSYRHRVSNPEQNLMYGPGRFFHDRDVEISYRRADVPSQELEVSFLMRMFDKLAAGGRLNLAISGDSISTGLDASEKVWAEPRQAGFAELVAAALQSRSRGEVRLTNRAVAGWSVSNGVADLPELLRSDPDLVIVAYGMNDVGRRDPSWFQQQTRELIEGIRAAKSECEIVLVAPMLGNREWVHTPREMFGPYRDALRELTGPGIVLADMTEVWTRLLERKHDLDLTGNGLNHPNDFGHRLYAQAILEAIGMREGFPVAGTLGSESPDP